MTTQERIDKINLVKSYLAGIELVLTTLNDTPWPSSEIATAASLVKKAQIELTKELAKLQK